MSKLTGMTTLFLTFALLLPNAYAQDYNTWGLPDSATMRFGKGGFTGNIAFSPEGTQLAVGSAIGIWIYDVRLGKEKERYLIAEHISAIGTIAYSPDPTVIASGHQDGNLKLWNVITGENIVTRSGHTDIINSVAFSPDGKTVVTGIGFTHDALLYHKLPSLCCQNTVFTEKFLMTEPPALKIA